ncbi:leucine aminopeptidase-like [Contarinia nasturtii]|uniref:leucine aminopeptidase-like n=1 Tax=Contarinia nasturtii TaxID=265458 RepID=UPI0012D3ED8E|nr:leucine aminopeptidase-like [Contarinia nasturtii]
MLTQLVQNPNKVEITEEWISLLETTYGFVGTRNSAYLFTLARLYVKGRLFNRLNQVFNFLNSNFRMKYVRPIYRDLEKWAEAKPLAIENFQKVQSQMMKFCAQSVAKDLGITIDI